MKLNAQDVAGSAEVTQLLAGLNLLTLLIGSGCISGDQLAGATGRGLGEVLWGRTSIEPLKTPFFEETLDESSNKLVVHHCSERLEIKLP